jgi:hypothetical protein
MVLHLNRDSRKVRSMAFDDDPEQHGTIERDDADLHPPGAARGACTWCEHHYTNEDPPVPARLGPHREDTYYVHLSCRPTALKYTGGAS